MAGKALPMTPPGSAPGKGRGVEPVRVAQTKVVRSVFVHTRNASTEVLVPYSAFSVACAFHPYLILPYHVAETDASKKGPAVGLGSVVVGTETSKHLRCRWERRRRPR